MELLDRPGLGAIMLAGKRKQSGRGSLGVGIVLSSKGVRAWKDAGSVIHDGFGPCAIAIRLLVQDDSAADIPWCCLWPVRPVVCPFDIHPNVPLIAPSPKAGQGTQGAGPYSHSSIGTPGCPAQPATGQFIWDIQRDFRGFSGAISCEIPAECPI